jgi:hypothetical protein
MKYTPPRYTPPRYTPPRCTLAIHVLARRRYVREVLGHLVTFFVFVGH